MNYRHISATGVFLLQIFIIEVRAKYNPFKTSKNYLNRNGAVMEITNEGGYLLTVFLQNMTFQEKLALKNGRIEFKIIEDRDTGFLLTLVDFGKYTMTFEIVFDPTLYKDNRRNVEIFDKSNTINIIGVESTTNTIKTLRYISIPNKLLARWKKAWTKMLTVENCNTKYMQWINNLYRYDLSTLWKRADSIAKIHKAK